MLLHIRARSSCESARHNFVLIHSIFVELRISPYCDNNDDTYFIAYAKKVITLQPDTTITINLTLALFRVSSLRFLCAVASQYINLEYCGKRCCVCVCLHNSTKRFCPQKINKNFVMWADFEPSNLCLSFFLLVCVYVLCAVSCRFS